MLRVGADIGGWQRSDKVAEPVSVTRLSELSEGGQKRLASSSVHHRPATDTHAIGLPRASDIDATDPDAFASVLKRQRSDEKSDERHNPSAHPMKQHFAYSGVRSSGRRSAR